MIHNVAVWLLMFNAVRLASAAGAGAKSVLLLPEKMDGKTNSQAWLVLLLLWLRL